MTGVKPLQTLPLPIHIGSDYRALTNLPLVCDAPATDHDVGEAALEKQISALRRLETLTFPYVCLISLRTKG